MAMTKKEQAAMQAAMQEAIDRPDLLAALRWTQKVTKDVAPPKVGYSAGWDYNAYSLRVEQGWSTSVSHGSGPAPATGTHKSGSQNASWLYSTEAMALAAMRHEVELESAKKLMQIDRRILALSA